MKTFHVRVYEADNPFYEGDIESIVVPAADGEYGVLAGHQNMAIALTEGTMRFRTGDQVTYGSGLSGKREIEPGTECSAVISAGMMRIENNDVLILIDSAEWPDEIYAERALRAKEQAMGEMLSKRSRAEYALAEASLKRAIARQRFVERNF